MPTTKHDTTLELLADIVRAFVFHPEEVKVIGSGSGGQLEVLELHVNAADYGLVFGKAGKKIQALQILAQFLGIKERRKIKLILPETERARNGGGIKPYTPNPKWDARPTLDLLRRILTMVLSQDYEVESVDVGGQTHIVVTVEQTDMRFMDVLTAHLHTIFHAIGKTEGREIYVTSTPKLPTDEDERASV